MRLTVAEDSQQVSCGGEGMVSVMMTGTHHWAADAAQGGASDASLLVTKPAAVEAAAAAVAASTCLTVSSSITVRAAANQLGIGGAARMPVRSVEEKRGSSMLPSHMRRPCTDACCRMVWRG